MLANLILLKSGKKLSKVKTSLTISEDDSDEVEIFEATQSSLKKYSQVNRDQHEYSRIQIDQDSVQIINTAKKLQISYKVFDPEP